MNKSIEELLKRLKEHDYYFCGYELAKFEADLVISALENQMPKIPKELCENCICLKCAHYMYDCDYCPDFYSGLELCEKVKSCKQFA